MNHWNRLVLTSLALTSLAGCPAPDDYLAPWPQSAVEARVYDEAPEPGPLRRKAEGHDAWHRGYSQPYYGAIVEAVRFAAPIESLADVPEVLGYGDWNDSCEWTGIYLASQAMRYHVTGDPSVKAHAIRTALALSRNLHVTGTPGFIARYSAPRDPLIYAGDAWCDAPAQDRCHRVETGEFAGDWWWGETSRDMYSGWFLGMSLAHDLIDDDDLRARIRADVTEVLDALITNHWRIIDEAGEPSTKAPEILPPHQVAWLLIGYHLTGEAGFAAALKTWLLDSQRIFLTLSSFSDFNRYDEYFANAISHELWYNILRLGRVYFSEADFAFFSDLFESQVHSFTRLSHNPFYNAVFMGQGAYAPAPGDPYQAQLVEDLSAFGAAPRTPFFTPARAEGSYVLDPVSVALSDLIEAIPILGEIFEFTPQALEAFPIAQQCDGILFERNPFQITACGADDPSLLASGSDYLIAYWMASYHGFIGKAE